LQGQFESGTPFPCRFFDGLHQDAAERRWRKQKLRHFQDARPGHDRLGKFVENGRWRL
jgi:hypothetical protein